MIAHHDIPGVSDKFFLPDYQTFSRTVRIKAFSSVGHVYVITPKFGKPTTYTTTRLSRGGRNLVFASGNFVPRNTSTAFTYVVRVDVCIGPADYTVHLSAREHLAHRHRSYIPNVRQSLRVQPSIRASKVTEFLNTNEKGM